MKKKIIALCLAAVIAVTAIASVTLAYLTDTDEAENVFTMGNVKIQQLEYERVKDANGAKTNEIQLFTNNQKVFPAVYDIPGTPGKTPLTVNGSEFQIRNFPNYVDKMVCVGNVGNSDAYVRVIVAVPVNPNESAEDNDVSENWLHFNYITDTDTSVRNGWCVGTPENKIEWDNDLSKHYVVHNVEIEGKLYDLTVFTNILPLAPSQETAPCVTGFYLDNDLNCDENGWYMPYNDEDGKFYVAEANEDMLAENLILVATQAVQTEGFADAWQAFAASFGEITEENHPWAN